MSDEKKPSMDEEEAVAKPAAQKPDQVFVVQRADKVVSPEDEDGYEVWVDIATVSIPANTPRRIALKEALTDSGLIPGTGPVKLRALDVKSAEVHEPKAVQPPMEWTL